MWRVLPASDVVDGDGDGDRGTEDPRAPEAHQNGGRILIPHGVNEGNRPTVGTVGEW